MHIEQAEVIASLINTRDEFKRVKNILVTDISGKLNGSYIITASSADIVVCGYNVTLSKPTIKTLLRLMDTQCNLIEQQISSLNEDIRIPIGGDGEDSTIATD